MRAGLLEICCELNAPRDVLSIAEGILSYAPKVADVALEFLEDFPRLKSTLPDLLRAHSALVKCFDGGHTLFLCGNGGSFADCLHISGELLKSFERRRGLTDSGVPPDLMKRFRDLPFGLEIASHLERGLPAVVLGANGSLSSAVQNDNLLPNMNYAQELYALGREGDVLIGISTGGNAKNVLYAVTVAKAIGMITIGLTGEAGGTLGRVVDIALRAPGRTTRRIQEGHLPIYHALCAMVEAHYFPEPR
ncbi:MAG: D-sedoheptulose-7-phosphate isomerase [bacterium]